MSHHGLYESNCPLIYHTTQSNYPLTYYTTQTTSAGIVNLNQYVIMIWFSIPFISDLRQIVQEHRQHIVKMKIYVGKIWEDTIMSQSKVFFFQVSWFFLRQSKSWWWRVKEYSLLAYCSTGVLTDIMLLDNGYANYLSFIQFKSVYYHI